MPEKKTDGAAMPDPNQRPDDATALQKAEAVFFATEAALVKGIEELGDWAHEELASLRSALTTALLHLRAAKPGGN